MTELTELTELTLLTVLTVLTSRAASCLSLGCSRSPDTRLPACYPIFPVIRPEHPGSLCAESRSSLTELSELASLLLSHRLLLSLEPRALPPGTELVQQTRWSERRRGWCTREGGGGGCTGGWVPGGIWEEGVPLRRGLYSFLRRARRPLRRGYPPS